MLVGVIQEIADATETSVAKRFGYAYIGADGTVEAAGPAPYLDCVGAPASPAVEAARQAAWLAEAEDQAAGWITANILPQFLDEIRLRRTTELQRVRAQVDKLLRFAQVEMVKSFMAATTPIGSVA